MSGPFVETTDGKLFRITLQGTLAPAPEKDVAAHAAEKAAASGGVRVHFTAALIDHPDNLLPGRRLAAGDFAAEVE